MTDTGQTLVLIGLSVGRETSGAMSEALTNKLINCLIEGQSSTSNDLHCTVKFVTGEGNIQDLTI